MGRVLRAGCAGAPPPLSARHREAALTGEAALSNELTELLQRLIRLDTTNPPGNETRAAELLRDYLEAAGVQCTLYARVPERANLVARIPGRGGGPSLALLSHTDVELGGRVLYLCATAEKMSSPFELRVHGRSGHAAMPSIADNALVKAAPLIERLGAFAVEPRLIPEVEAFLAALLGEIPVPGEALARAREVAPLAGELIEPLLGLTVAPTKAHASDRRNVIPALCSITVDTRLLPGQTPEEAEEAIRVWLGPGDYELVNTERFGGTRSEIRGPLWDAVRSFVETEEPGAAPAPICVAGFTDSHWMREAFGTVAYGFFPSRTMDSETAARLIHSANERVPVSDLELGTRWLRHAAQAVCA